MNRSESRDLLLFGGSLLLALAQNESRNPLVGRIYFVFVTRDLGKASLLKRSRRHPKLGDTDIDKKIEFLSMEEGLSRAASAGVIILGGPTHIVRGIARSIAPYCESRNPIIITTNKGIEAVFRGGKYESYKTTDVVIEEEFKGKVRHAFMGGASFAKGLAREEFTVNYLASRDIQLAKELAEWLSTDSAKFIPTDQMGLQWVAVFKHVGAVLAGMTMGLNSAENTRAAIVGRTFRDMSAFCEAKGIASEILQGPGLEDLVLCSGEGSSHYKLGIKIAKAYKRRSDPRKRFRIYRSFSRVWLALRSRTLGRIVSASKDLYVEILVDAIASSVTDVVESIFYPPALIEKVRERVREISESSKSVSLDPSDEVFYSLPSLQREIVRLKLTGKIVTVRELYRYSRGQQSPEETIDRIKKAIVAEGWEEKGRAE